ncbi:hypothetical protein VNO77_46294 [Canavalia gladiata]|uniref:Uncharacterized protein n=1 Tax=Canavalia gladiata TaxID=3824 RepID=A0AAN9JF17_CANGL
MELAFSKNRARSLGFSLRNARGMVDLTHEPTIRDSAFRFENNIGKGSGFQLIRKGFELAFQILQASGKLLSGREYAVTDDFPLRPLAISFL